MSESYRHPARPRAIAFAVHLLLAGTVLNLLPAVAAAATAADTQATTPKSYAIAAGPLGEVLAQFAARAGVRLSFDPIWLSGRESPGLNGEFTVDEGFERILAGSGYELQPLDGGVHGLRRRPDSPRGRNEATLSTIVVTGEKSLRSLLDTSSSVDIYDAERIESLAGANGLRDLLQQTPNVLDVGSGNDLPTVRGVDGSGPARGAYAFLGGTRPRLNLSVDGRSLTYNELAFGPQSVWDLAQVEVFRGPQSHVQGRNAIAGAIVLSSRDPSFSREMAFKGGIGEQGSSQLAAMISGPLVDNELAFRISVDRQKRESHVDMVSYEPVGNPRQFEITTARAKLLYKPAAVPGLSSMLTLSHYDSRAPQNETLIPPPALQGARFSPFRPVFETRSTSTTWDLAWQLSDRLSLENKLIYTEFANDRLTLPTIQYANIDGREFQVEPLLRFRNDSVHGLAGLRYFHSSQDEFVNLYGGSSFADETTTASAFAEITHALRSDLDLTLSGRLEREQRRREGGSTTVRVDFDETYNTFLPKINLAWKPAPGHTLGTSLARGYNAGGVGITFGTPVVSYAYEPEYVTNYEIYSRHRLLDDRLEITTNLFYNIYKDMQLPYYVGTSAIIRNAERAITQGAELGARWLARRDLELFASLGLLKTKIRRFADSGVEGNELARAPAYTANLGANWKFARGFELGGNVMFSDTYYSYFDNDPRGKIPSYHVVNAQLAYNFKGGRATLYVHNLFDTDKWLMVVDNDVNSPVIQRPRLIGASLELNF